MGDKEMDEIFDAFFEESKEEETSKEEEEKTKPVIDRGGLHPAEEKAMEIIKEHGLEIEGGVAEEEEIVESEESGDELNGFFSSDTEPEGETVVQPKNVESVEAEKPIEPVDLSVEFDLSPEKGRGKQVILIYGLKGAGKTDLSFSFPGKIACISFDHKSLPIKENRYRNDERITVYDGIRYLNSDSPESVLESSELTFRYLIRILDELAKDEKRKPDWVVIDGSDILQRICEMVMRYRNNLMPFQGIANRNLWKERRLYISQIHNKALNAARRGLIWTTYVDKDRIVKEGELIVERDVPKWIDAIMTETDVVIKVEKEIDKSGIKYYAIIESSKFLEYPNGSKVEVTNEGIKAINPKLGGV